MKEILIMRHAKSDWHSEAKTDFERPLNERGKKAAPKMAEALLQLKLKPDLILCSPAKRAHQTLKKVIEVMNHEGEVVFVDEFYHGGFSEALDALQGQDDKYKRILLIGHNPTWEMLSTNLSKKLIDVMMPTAAVIYMKFAGEHWRDVEPRSCDYQWIITPKSINI